MTERIDHRTEAEDALAKAQRNPVMSAEQSFLSAQVHALLALEDRLAEIAVALQEARLPQHANDAGIRTEGNGASRSGATNP